MRIRRATLADAKELSVLRKATIREINKCDYSPAQIARWSKRRNTDHFVKMHEKVLRYVAVEDEKIIGFADILKEKPEVIAIIRHPLAGRNKRCIGCSREGLYGCRRSMGR